MIYRNRIIFGKNVRINNGVFLHGAGGIVVGENTTLSYGTTILSTGYETNNWNLDNSEKIHKDEQVKIGENVWICANVTLLPGTEVADNCIVAAGSVVNKKLLSPGYLYAGVPARKIKKI